MRNEYPRPDFVRDQWMSLNGEWTFAEVGSVDGTFVENMAEEEHLNIEVPFVPQSSLSGLNKTLTSDRVIYERMFEVPKAWTGKRILLHFGAVDYQCSVWVNEHCVGEHQGGQTPFAFDITDVLCGGQERLRVCVVDYLYDECVPRGKQFWQSESRFIWYTPYTGIWQSVWMEPVEPAHIQWIHFTPDIDAGTVAMTWQVSDAASYPYRMKVNIRFGDESIYEAELSGNHKRGRIIADVFEGKALRGSFHFAGWCWSPEQPSLFDVTVQLFQKDRCVDHVETYFGMRKIHVQDGRIYLNNQPYYQKLVLDQGYWKDGLITAPSEKAFIEDIQKAKAMGFNGCRKHEKAEDPVFLYWADRLGFLVWGSMSSFWSFTPQYGAAFAKEWSDIIFRDYNHPCIVVWNMMNESWGLPGLYDNRQQQHFARSMYHLARGLDDTRLVIANDGWEMTENDICAFHSYKHGDENDEKQQRVFAEGIQSIEGMEMLVEKSMFARGFAYGGQPVMLTEVGGITVKTKTADEHSEEWGYTAAKDTQSFIRAYERLIDSIYASDLICGFCYTQLTDIEQEKNGLLDEEHRWKVEAEKIREINDRRSTGNVFRVPAKTEAGRRGE